MATAEDYADRGRALAEELGFNDFRAHGLCLGAMSRRFTGRLDEAVELAAQATELAETPDDARLEPGSPARELVKAVAFLAGAARDTAIPVPALASSNDPVVWVGWLMLVEGILLAGRVDDAQQVIDAIADLPGLGGAIDGMTRNLAVAFGLLMIGRPEEAGPMLRECLVSARAVRSHSMMQAAHALLAEVHARTGAPDEAGRELEKAGEPARDGVCGAFVLRARAAVGDGQAAADLRAVAEKLGAPGLVLGLD
jgi:hypothetical protein